MSTFNYRSYSEDPVLLCKDNTFSKESFELRYNDELDMLVTHPAPPEEELPRYYKSENYISHTDSTKSFLDRIYQLVKRYMLNKKLQWIEDESKTRGRLLDIGAGTGDFLLAAKNRGWKVSGVEPDGGARKLAASKGVELESKTEFFEPGSFDVITMWHVLEHVSDLHKQISELQRLLKKEGLLIVAVPNFKSYDAHTYKEHWAAFDVPRHLWHFSRNAIHRIFSSASFEVVKEKPLAFDSFYVSMLSEKFKGGLSVKGVFNGLISNLIARKTKEYSSIAYFLRKSS